MFMHDLFAKTVAQAAHADRDVIILHRLRDPFLVDGDLFFFRHTQPIQVKKTAKKESSTITRKIACTTAAVVRRRSEEHTSELQSLMRISYAVFCLKKKNKKKTTKQNREKKKEQSLITNYYKHRNTVTPEKTSVWSSSNTNTIYIPPIKDILKDLEKLHSS